MPEVAMKRIIIVPITETGQFPGMEILARGGSIAALVGDTFEARTRSAFDSEDSFFMRSATARQISTPSTPWAKPLILQRARLRR
jgi:hypothetical protein